MLDHIIISHHKILDLIKPLLCVIGGQKIHQSEHEGHVKFDKVLVAAEVLLQDGNQETRNITHARLKELKALWEETCTYIIHCHR